MSQGLWDEHKENKTIEDSKAKVEQAVQRYLSLSPQPPESGFDYLYETLPKELHPQRDALINKAMRMQGGKHE